MTWIGKKEFGIWSGRGNPESKREGVGNRSVFGVAFWDWDVVAKRFWGAFSGRGLRGVSSDCESMDKTPHRKYSVIIPLIKTGQVETIHQIFEISKMLIFMYGYNLIEHVLSFRHVY
jgi:hypothetical protein